MSLATPPQPVFNIGTASALIEKIERIYPDPGQPKEKPNEPKLYNATVAIELHVKNARGPRSGPSVRLTLPVTAYAMHGVNEAVRKALQQWAIAFAKVVDQPGSLD